jgi:uncharacterized membrane protein SpoIIM required for sporulation
VDLDTYVAAHRPEWTRLETLIKRSRRPRGMSGPELDELVELYQRVATHLSVIQTRSPDPALVNSLSLLVTHARAAVTGAREPGWHEVGRFFTVTFPAAVYARRWWVLGVALGSIVVAVGLGIWLANTPRVQDALLPGDEVRSLCERDFAEYYRSNPASSFAAQVWTNNAWVSAGAIAFGGLLGIPTVAVLLYNAANGGLVGGYMASCGRTDQFFTLILPHGMLELTAVFVAGAVGLRLGWSIIDPGPKRRTEALAAEGRTAVAVALGLAAVLAVSGVIEAFVTPSPLPPQARLAIGALAEAAFLAYIWWFGRRASALPGAGDIDSSLAEDLAPVV